MITREQLQARAAGLARDVAEAELGVLVEVRPEGSALDWHGTLLRHIFEQNVSVWQTFTSLDLITDERGAVIGYVDHEAYKDAGSETGLADGAVRGLVADEELLPAYTRIVQRDVRPGPQGGKLVVVTAESPPGRRTAPQRWQIEINPARQMIAAVRPLGPVIGDGGA